MQKKKQCDLKKRRVLIRKQNESNKEVKQNERKQKRQNIMADDIVLGKFFELASSYKIYVTGLNLHKIETEFLLNYTGHFELIGLMIIGPVEGTTYIKFRNMGDFESCIKGINVDYDGENDTFTGYVFYSNTPQINVIKRSAYVKGTNYKEEFVEYYGQNCYITNSGMCFVKFIKYFTDKDHTEENLDFLRNEKYRSGVKTSA